jgi:sporulation protein YlmC with PRC-barrel domain
MKILTTTAVITACGFGLAFGAAEEAGQAQHEQEREQTQQQEFGMRAGEEGDHKKLSDLRDSKLMGQDGEELGQFEDVVVDLETGAISFIIVADENDQRRPVPITAVQVEGSDEQMELVLNIDRQTFEQGESIGRDEVAQLGQDQRASEIYQHYGEDWQAFQQQQMEFAAPQQREQGQQQQQEHGQQQPDQQQTQQLERQIQQGMTQAGVDQEQAREEAQKLARKFSQEQPDQQEIQQELEQTLTQAGVDQQRAQQEAQRLSQQIHQQIEFGSPQQDRQESHQDQQQQPGQEQNEYGSPAERQQIPMGQTEQRMAPGQEEEQQEQYGARDQHESIKLGRDLLEAKVHDQEREEIGEISDLILDLEQGSVLFALIEATEADGHFAVSVRALQPEGEDAFRLNISSQELEQAQSISEQDLQMHARQQQQIESAQLQQSPEVFRYQEEETGLFGVPERRDEQEIEARDRQDSPLLQQQEQRDNQR